MRWKLILVAAGGVLLLASNPCAAQTSSVPSFRSPTCNAFCDLVTAIKKGLPSGQSAAAAQQSAAPAQTQSQIAPPAVAAKHTRERPRRARIAAERPANQFRIYASGQIKSLDDLRGQPVSLGLNGSHSQSLARKALAEAGVTIQEVPLDADNAFDALSIGAIKAMAVTGGGSYAMMDAIPSRYGVHQIELPKRPFEAQRAQRQREASLSPTRDK
jgi:NMT1-like family